MTWTGLSTKRRALAASVLVACTALFTGRKVFEYSSPPEREKTCDFIFPADLDVKPTTLVVKSPQPPIAFEKQAGFINDASCLNKTPIYGIVKVQGVDDVTHALEFARLNRLKVSIAGQRHSMGGQTFSANGVVLDMRSFDRISLDRDRKVVHAQAGATWGQIQQLIDSEGLACPGHAID